MDGVLADGIIYFSPFLLTGRALTTTDNLGREYKIKTFTSPFRPSSTKLYMLSIDAARAAGFRDSLYFFRRNILIHKLSCSQVEKDRLIELGSLATALKSRSVTIVSARNVFKVLGATIIHSALSLPRFIVDALTFYFQTVNIYLTIIVRMVPLLLMLTRLTRLTL